MMKFIHYKNRPAKIVGKSLTGVFIETTDKVIDEFITYTSFIRMYGYDPRQEKEETKLPAQWNSGSVTAF